MDSRLKSEIHLDVNTKGEASGQSVVAECIYITTAICKLQYRPTEIAHMCHDERKSLSRNCDALFLQITSEVGDEFQLFVDAETADNRLEDSADGDMTLTNQASVVHIRENTH